MDIKIENKIKRIKDIFGPIKERDNKNMSFTHLIRLFDVIKKHLRGIIGDETALRILLIMEKIKKMMRTLLKKIEINKIGNVNYAQTVYWGAVAPKIKHSQVIEPPKENPIKEKQLLIRIIDALKAEAIHKLFIRALMERITTNLSDK